MSKLIIMVGLPGSGKSYAAHVLNKENDYEILYSDAFRKRMFGDENDQAHNEQVFAEMHKWLRAYLTYGRDVIYDATNTTVKARKHIFSQIQGIPELEVEAIVMNTPVEECILRDSFRERHAGSSAIYKFYLSFQFPQKFEGFDRIKIWGYNYIPEFNLDFYRSVKNLMLETDQKNPHHIHSLGEHCQLVADNYETRTVENMAATFHDVGKLFTQKIDDQGIAHYYSHDSIGTYYLISHLPLIAYSGTTWDDIFEILFYVNWHMRAHKELRTEKAEKKYRKLFGDERYEKLLKFADNDIIASGTESIHDKLTKWIKEDKLTLDEIRNKRKFKKLLK